MSAMASDPSPTTAAKIAAYEQLLQQAESLFADSRHWVSNTANAAALLWHALKALEAPSSAVNWAGFYFLPTPSNRTLILGPFQGKVACQSIELGKGVCGTAAASLTTQVVPDVHAFPGHIACDADSNSEIVVPIVTTDRNLLGVIDIDCAHLGGFDAADRRYLEQLAALLARSCDWPAIPT